MLAHTLPPLPKPSSQAFPENRLKEELNFSDFVECWLRYLDDEEDPQAADLGEAAGAFFDSPVRSNTNMSAASEASVTVSDQQGAFAEPRGKQLATSSEATVVDPALKFIRADKKRKKKRVKQKHWLAQYLRELYLRMRHKPITPLLESPETSQNIYRSSFVTIVGDIKRELPRASVPEFLTLLLLDHVKTNKITELHVKEFMAMFSLEGSVGDSVSWPDIERGLRESKYNVKHTK